ncbi:hypothetical protein MMC07_009942 [Pseudocyphellaria aurata]|nr:hypothetical protein [Pseudocyphellaria aurata]
MSTYDTNPRSSKRRKLSKSPSPREPIPTRALRRRKGEVPVKFLPSEPPATSELRSKAIADVHDASSGRHQRSVQEKVRDTSREVHYSENEQIPPDLTDGEESAEGRSGIKNPGLLNEPSAPTPTHSGRKRGRPRKTEQVPESTPTHDSAHLAIQTLGRKRGRPRKVDQVPESSAAPASSPIPTRVSDRKQGRPRKVDEAPESTPAPEPAPLATQASGRSRGRPRKADEAPESTPAPEPSPEPTPLATQASGRSRGRPRKVDEVPESTPTPESTPIATRASGRSRGRPRKVDQVPESTAAPESSLIPTRVSNRKQGRPRKSTQVPESTPSPEPAPLAIQASGRSRGRPRKLDEASESTPAPESAPIATRESGRNRGRPRKVVIIADPPRDHSENDFAFNTIPAGDIPAHHGARAANSSKAQISNELKASEHIKVHTPLKENQKRTKAAKEALSPSQAEDGTSTSHSSSDEDDQNPLEKNVSVLKVFIEEDTTDSLMMLKSQILEGLTGRRLLPLVGLEQEYQKVHQIVEQTVLAGEGNSALVIGSRGTAKTTLVESVIADLASDHRDVFHVVRLNGFIHTDDKVALREIWRQLGREMKVEDDSMGVKGNYADTLTSLLALLAHPAGNIDANVNQTAKSIIFILDEFDLFASHPRQTLLYNLFDVAQSRNAPIIVLGLTTKVNVVASLEKRVKSRFGQRYIHLSLSRTLSSFKAVCKSALIPPTNISTRLNPINPSFQGLLKAWTGYVEALFEHDPILNHFLQTLYSQSKSVPAFLAAAILPVSHLSSKTLSAGSLVISTTLLPPDSKLHLLRCLSDSELALLIAAARLDIVLDSDTCTFGMVYDEYVQLASKVKIASSAAGQAAVGGGARVWGREVAKEAWERLVDLELVVPVSGVRGGGVWRVDVALEEIAPSVPELGTVMAKWCREI